MHSTYSKVLVDIIKSGSKWWTDQLTDNRVKFMVENGFLYHTVGYVLVNSFPVGSMKLYFMVLELNGKVNMLTITMLTR